MPRFRIASIQRKQFSLRGISAKRVFAMAAPLPAGVIAPRRHPVTGLATAAPDDPHLAAVLQRIFAAQNRAAQAAIASFYGGAAITKADEGDGDNGSDIPIQRLLDREHWDKAIALTVAPLIEVHAQDASARLREQLPEGDSGEQGSQERDREIVHHLTMDAIPEAIDSLTANLARAINGTTVEDLTRVVSGLRNELLNGIISGDARPELARRVASVFQSAGAERAARIAQTETSRAIHTAEVLAAKASGLPMTKQWLISPDACPICQGFYTHGVVPMDHHYAAEAGPYGIIDHPPAHPNCQCSMLYGVPSPTIAPKTIVAITKADDDDDGHWVTINGNHVFIGGGGEVPSGAVHVKPAGIREMLEFPPSPLQRDPSKPPASMAFANRTLKRIDAIHKLPPSPPKVKIYGANEAGMATHAVGEYHENGGTPGYITIMVDHPGREFYLTHEIGHYVDNVLGLQKRRPIPGAVGRLYGSEAESDHDYDAWRQAVQASAPIKKMQAVAASGELDGKEIGDGTERFIDYATSGREMFARSYAQWVATRSGDKGMLKASQAAADQKLPLQWTPQQFKPIGAALDKLFKAKGLAT